MKKTNGFWKAAGQIHEFAMKARDRGITEADITLFTQSPERMDDLKKLARGGIVSYPTDKILSMIECDIKIPAVWERVSLDDYLRINIGQMAKKQWREGDIKIVSIDGEIREFFGGQMIDGDVGQYLSAYEIAENKTNDINYDGRVRFELGDNHEVKFTTIFHLLRQQPKGESEGSLRIDKCNKFYVIDNDGEVRCVCIQWWEAIGGWGISICKSNLGRHIGGQNIFFARRGIYA
ncbi:MAG: hypothetical protein WAV11_02575 [Minisyncoccia bacterium]